MLMTCLHFLFTSNTLVPPCGLIWTIFSHTVQASFVGLPISPVLFPYHWGQFWIHAIPILFTSQPHLHNILNHKCCFWWYCEMSFQWGNIRTLPLWAHSQQKLKTIKKRPWKIQNWCRRNDAASVVVAVGRRLNLINMVPVQLPL